MEKRGKGKGTKGPTNEIRAAAPIRVSANAVGCQLRQPRAVSVIAGIDMLEFTHNHTNASRILTCPMLELE